MCSFVLKEIDKHFFRLIA